MSVKDVIESSYSHSRDFRKSFTDNSREAVAFEIGCSESLGYHLDVQICMYHLNLI